MNHVESFIEFTSSEPSIEYERRCLETFNGLMIDRYTRSALEKDLGNVFHSSWHHARPTLATLLAISTYFDTPPHWILTSPMDAAAQFDLGFDPVVHGRSTRTYGDPLRADRARKILNDAIHGPSPYPSIPMIASLSDTSTGYLRAKYGKEVTQLIELRRTSDSAAKIKKTRKLKNLLKDCQRPKRLATKKELLRWSARTASTSIHHARQVWAAMLMSSIPHDHPKRARDGGKPQQSRP